MKIIFNSLDTNKKAMDLKAEIEKSFKNGDKEGAENSINVYKELRFKAINEDVAEQKALIEKAKFYSINEIENDTKDQLLTLEIKRIEEMTEIEKEINNLKEIL